MPRRKHGNGKRQVRKTVRQDKKNGNKGNRQHEIEGRLSQKISRARTSDQADTWKQLVNSVNNHESPVTDVDFKRLGANDEKPRRQTREAYSKARAHAVA
jgi:hypothetical protein